MTKTLDYSKTYWGEDQDMIVNDLEVDDITVGWDMTTTWDISADDINSGWLIIRSQTPQTLTGAWAVDVVSTVTLLVTTAADALTLADGVEWQEKYIVMKTDWGDGTLTPANLWNGTTITFDNADTAYLLFVDWSRFYMGGNAALA